MTLVPKLPDLVSKRNNTDDLQLFPKVNDNQNKSVKYSFKKTEEKPFVNIKTLKWLIDVQENYTSDDSHEIFMENYKRIFEKDNKFLNQKKSIVPSMIEREKDAKIFEKIQLSKSQALEEEIPKNDIAIYLEEIHGKKPEIVDPHLKKMNAVRKLRKLLKTLPFERTENDNKKIFSIVKQLGFFNKVLPNVLDYTLEKLLTYATLEVSQGINTPIFGNFGYYSILKGSVLTLSDPYINLPGTRFRPFTPDPPERTELEVGDSFGTLSELQNREITTRMLRVLTLEEGCEFMKIGINDYSKINEKIKNEKHDEKSNLVFSCESYVKWPKHAVEDLLQILDWETFHENTILTTEGYRSPFMGFIQKGVCHVLRKVDVLRKNEDGKDVPQMKQVVIGKLREKESFGELSVILKEPMTCSIVTETECRIGVIQYEKIFRLDDITRRLLIHTNKRNFSNLTQDDLHKQYIDQQLKKEWVHFKNYIVNDIVDKYGVTHGVKSKDLKVIEKESEK